MSNTSFASLGLSSALLEALEKQGYTEPSPIQAQAIPVVLEGRDIMAAAQTGTGKTAGFTLPILERFSDKPLVKSNHVRALIVTPTRELAAQILDSVQTYGANLPLRSAVVFGGVKINPQMMKLRSGVDILVATPGRLLDLHQQNAVKFAQLEILVLDEADRMLDMGFIHDIKKILALLPKQRQNLLFSATFSDDIRKLAKGLVNDPVEVSVSPRNTTVNTVEHWICPVDKAKKSALLVHLVSTNDWKQVLVFCRTKHGANRLAKYLAGKNINSSAIHGNKSQGARTKALADFKRGAITVLVATDIAARGIDISALPHVVNVDLPNVPEDYVHRIGRTGRAGATGKAVSLVCADEIKQLSDIERLIGKLLERRVVDGFEPSHDVPVSKLNAKPFKAPRPNKPNKGHKAKHQSRDGNKSAKPSRRSRAAEEGNAPKGNSAKPKKNVWGGRGATPSS
ncbi:MAG: ATP-dependent RNA helicase RhlE [Saprospiraceae bacterium]|jgi:ATP-dependent RNA helicase RhlE